MAPTARTPVPGSTGRAIAVSIPKARTGVAGLDDVLLGGVPRGRATLVGGGPGTGKTMLGLEFLYRGAVAGEPGLLVSFEEDAEAIRRNAGTFGWDLAALERAGMLVLLDLEPPIHSLQSGDFDLGGLLAILGGKIRDAGIQRVLIDAVDVLLRIFPDPRRQEDELILLHDWLVDHEQTVLLTVKASGDSRESMHRLDYLTDCVLRLDHRVLGQVSTRRLRVLKYRGSGFLSNEYPYVIVEDGIVLMPISTIGLKRPASDPSRFETGVVGLDRLLDGGLYRGSSVLLGGPSGTGKTLLACTIAAAAARRGERVAYVTFEEGIEALQVAVRSAGIDLRPEVERGALHLLTAMPEAKGVEEHLWQLITMLEQFRPQHLVVDAISACARMGSEAAAFDFLIRLMTECKARGVTCIYLNQVDPGNLQEISGIGLSSLIDALLVLDQQWPADDSHLRRMLIVKMRGSRHAHCWNLFRITDAGLEFETTGGGRPGDAS
jgi:circadian clock protein KaiC